MRHSRRTPLVRASALAALLALGACADRGPLGPEVDPSGASARSEAGTAAFNGRIRIGVVPSASSVTIGSAADYTIRDRSSGAVLLTGSNGTATVTLASVVQSWLRLQVTCGSTATVAARQAAAEAAGYETHTEFVPAANCTRLYLGRFAPPPAPTWSARVAFRNKAIAEGHAGTDSFWRVVAEAGATAYRVARGAEVVTSHGPVVLTSSDGVVTIAGVRYRDQAEVRVNASGTLAGINELPLEQYLYGVVPKELGPIQYPEFEAQKAQAVAARTYALAGLGKRSSNGYDLLASTADQAYGGLAVEHSVSTAAVDATAGVAATHGGRLISTLYHSTSGGHTADNEEAYASSPVAYLRGVPDAERGRALEHVPTLEVFRSHASPVSLRASREGDFESDWARYHRWTFEWTMDEISRVISAFAGRPVGRVLAVNVLERGPSGRVLRIEYVTEAGSFHDTKDRIRSSLRFINSSGTPVNLLSTLFFVEPVVDRRTREVTGFRAYGGGFGHGVGMSQTGAVGMAQKGHGYEEILRHYYRGVELVKRY